VFLGKQQLYFASSVKISTGYQEYQHLGLLATYASAEIQNAAKASNLLKGASQSKRLGQEA
jgi:hypothetical protein